MLNKNKIARVAIGALLLGLALYSAPVQALQYSTSTFNAALNASSSINTTPAADLLLLAHLRTDILDDSTVEVAALDSTGIPTLPGWNRGNGPIRNYNVFGSVVVPVGALPAAKGWNHALGPNVANVFGLDCSSDCGSGLRGKLLRAVREARGLSALEALDTVNRAVNRNLVYRSDKEAWGVDDYWASPEEIIRVGAGDCEDFATTKLWLLRSAGFTDEQLQLVVLKDTRRQLYHAVLAVHVDGKAYILDNLSNAVASDTAFISYVPVMSFVGGKNYLHGFKDRRTGVAANIGDVLPGE